MTNKHRFTRAICKPEKAYKKKDKERFKKEDNEQYEERNVNNYPGKE